VVYITAQLLLSLVLLCSAWTKLSFEFSSTDRKEVDGFSLYLTNPNPVFERAVQLLSEDSGQDVVEARRLLEGLVRTNAASADRWANLGSVLVRSRDPDKAEYCFLRAIDLAPNTADNWLAVANFYIDRKQFRSALPYLGKVLASTNREEAVFNAFDAARLSFNGIVANGGLPDRPEIADHYFRHLLENGDIANSHEAWQWFRPRTPDDQLAAAYTQFLLMKGRLNEAAEVWRSQVATREPEFGKASFVLNGGFEQENTATPFDWRIAADDHVEASRDNTVAHSGRSSLRLQFDGKINSTYEGVSQRVFLPRGSYRFEAFVRTAGITTDEGVGFRLRKVTTSGNATVETARITGTNDWRRLEAELVVDSPVELIEIEVFRRQSLRFDNLISGTAWIDQVSLSPMN
jgi:hypothetical protein